jgi:chromate transporter
VAGDVTVGAMGPDVAATDPVEETPARASNAAIFARFLRFGLLAWGGPVAQIAMLRRDLVRDEHWISSSRFNRLLAVYQVLPGPEAHELCVHLGMLRGGRLGALLAGLGFMLPGFVLMLGLSWLYFQVDLKQAAIGSVLLGVQIAVLALIVRAVEQIGRHIVVDVPLFTIGAATAIASLAGASFWLTLPLAGALYLVALRVRQRWLVPAVAAALAALAVAASGPVFGPIFPTEAAPSSTAGSAATHPPLPSLFASGLKAGLLTFGGAYTVIPFLRGDAVGNGWMSDSTFLDGLALSSILPAPLIIFSTFVGYVAGGVAGAVAMTVAIFLPAFGFTLLFGDQLAAIVDNRELRTLLKGVAAGVVGLIVATTVELTTALVGRLPSVVPAALIFTGALVVLSLWKSKANVVLVIFGAGLAGWIAFGAG